MAADRKPEFFAGKDLKIGIIGCGYVGLPLALRFADVGQRVTGFDTDQEKIDKLNAGQSYIQHIPADKIEQHVQGKRFDATTDFTRLRDMDAVLICVPTPLDERREPDLSYVEKTAQSIAPNLQRNQLIVLESTTYPGHHRGTSAADSRKGRLEAARSRAARERRTLRPIFIWRFRPSAKIRETSNSAWRRFRRLSAASIRPAAGRRRRCTRRSFRRVVPVSSTRAAEMVKLLENIFRCVNIALVNELKQLSPAHGAGHLGSDRQRRDEAFRLHAVLSRAGPRRALHPGGPLLSFLEGARVRFRYALHRTGRRNQYCHALPRGGCVGERAERARKEPEGLEGAAAGRGVQERCGRPARIAFAETARAAHGARAPSSITTIPISRPCTRCATTIFRT